MAGPDDSRGRFKVSPAPDRREAAAIAAAIQRFTADTTAPPATGPAKMDPWLEAGLREGVLSAQSFGPPRPEGT